MKRITLEIRSSFGKVLDRFASRNGISADEAVRRALAVISLAEAEASRGRSLGIVEEDRETGDLHAVGCIRGL